ncbi:rhodanese-like domain-containing protein [Ramlibacter sp.]|uniref:rhodanese-like domain-containing protein n=1 Tax=Ramlibacter sp. TaxID=1917967 RepID=UPI00260C7B47|nr:rhodanese-like domain-containing protein [Ramlibacter sp.]MDB5954846.1 Rhodanese-like protein [Ramlibacter sp.]
MTESVLNAPVGPVAADGIDAATLLRCLRDGLEIALVDVREHGQYGEGHPFLAVSAPYSRLEIDVPLLVPRRATRVVLFDDGDGVAARAARRLRDAGYTQVQVLQGGARAWAAAGRTLFQGQNLPSKTFGECVEHAFTVPQLSAQQLHARLASGEPLVLLDGRTLQEHRRMTIPGAIPVPNGELALRWRSVVPDEHTPVVVHCAGRTRSIVGAQILRDLGLPNPVYALENGTQGWALAGLELEKGSARGLPAAPRSHAQASVRKRAQSFAQRAGVPQLAAREAQAWLDDAERTTHVFDVRTAAEFATGSLPGARHVPGGQLLQTTDQHVGVRHARVLLLDDDGIRAPVIAAWLLRLGIDAAVVEGGIAAPLRVPVAAATLPPALPEQDAGALLALRQDGSSLPLLIDLRPSADYRQGHAAGARWSIRPRILATVAHASNPLIVLLAEDEAVARLAAPDLRQAGHARIAWLRAATLADAGWPQEATPHSPADADRIDYLFFVHDRHDGNLDAARRYLQWETGLVAQCATDELATFRLPAQARRAA